LEQDNALEPELSSVKDPDLELPYLLSVVAAVTEISERAIVGGSRNREISTVRSLFAFLAVKNSGKMQ
jgi:site-specific recombinase XerD